MEKALVGRDFFLCRSRTLRIKDYELSIKQGLGYKTRTGYEIAYILQVVRGPSSLSVFLNEQLDMYNNNWERLRSFSQIIIHCSLLGQYTFD